MGVSKVIYGNNTLIDLTGDTVTANKLMSGETAHGADGNLIVGTATSANLQETKDITATTNVQSIDPDTGYDGFRNVHVYPTPSLTGYATPSETGRILYPPSGKYFSGVEIDPIPSEYIIPSGEKYIYISENTPQAIHDVKAYENVNIEVDVQAEETTLWTNSSPSSAFQAQSISVGDLTSYDYIKIVWRWSISDSTTFETVIPNDTKETERRAIGGSSSTSITPRYRYCSFAKTTGVSMAFSNSVLHSSSSQTPSADHIIPVKIIGLKSPLKGAPLDPSETTLWTNPSPTSNFGTTSASGTTISLSTPLTAFDQIAIYVRYSTSDSQERKFIYDYDSLSNATDSEHSLAIGFVVGSSTSRVRLFYKASSSRLGFPWGTYRLQQGSQTASTAYIIPTKVTGIMLHST